MSRDSGIDVHGFRQLEHRGWTEVAVGYDRAFARLTRQAVEPMLDEAAVRAGTVLLDVASGPGEIVAAAGGRGAQATGLDFSSTMVAVAKRLHPDSDFREGDAEALPFPDASFDAVTIAFGLLHFARPDRALAEASRVLRPGGRIAATVWDQPERATTFGLILAAIEAQGTLDVGLPAGPGFFLYSDPLVMRRALEEAGFDRIAVRAVPLSWRVPNADTLLDLAMEGGVRTRAVLHAQSPEQLAAIRLDLRERCMPYERDGELELPTPCVLASGEKP